ncbi:MAG TPA: hypothetical protein VMW53_07340 [archaeon]|nr:hypothetical protein [archaeon]
MKKLKTNPLRLRINHKRFPHDLIIEIDGEVAKCKYCGRIPLVGGFDFTRTRDDKEMACCYECYEDGRAYETVKDSLIGLGFAMAGLKKRTFPWAPEEGTPETEVAGICRTCGKSVLYNPYTRMIIDGYYEHLREAYFHDDCKIT